MPIISMTAVLPASMTMWHEQLFSGLTRAFMRPIQCLLHIFTGNQYPILAQLSAEENEAFRKFTHLYFTSVAAQD